MKLSCTVLFNQIYAIHAPIEPENSRATVHALMIGKKQKCFIHAYLKICQTLQKKIFSIEFPNHDRFGIRSDHGF
jgi:hypothetical protein